MPTRRPATSCIPVGLVVGEGTGPELRAAFLRALAALTADRAVDVRVIECAHRFRTFSAALDPAQDAAAAARIEDDDASLFEEFLRVLHRDGCRVLFRTAFNAAALYRARERLRAIKVEWFEHGQDAMLLVRDQAQGFYAGANDLACDPDRIVRTCEFRRDTTHEVLDAAHRLAREKWGAAAHAARFVVVCKFHLLDNRFARWVDQWSRARDVAVSVFQPDTANRHLLDGAFRGRVVVVGSNEWGDIMHADIIARHARGKHADRFSRNVYLAADVAGLVEYQTVHGSADDIAGQDRVDPTATLRAAADLLEHAGRVRGAVARMEDAIAHVAWDARSCRAHVHRVTERLRGSVPAEPMGRAADGEA